MLRVILFSFFCLFITQSFSSSAHAKRIALVIGNNQYKEVEKLKKAVNDARVVSRTLQDLGFDVTTHIDLTSRGMNKAIYSEFISKIENGDEVVFYYAGHGVEIRNRNFLLATDIPRVKPGNERFVTKEAFAVDEIITAIQERGSRISIIILDACRNNPFPREGTRSLGASRGLASLAGREPPKGTFIMYSAGSNQTALDRLSNTDTHPNSVFTRKLTPLLKTPGLSLNLIARKIRDQVEELANTVQHTQYPAYYDQTRGDYYFLQNKKKSEKEGESSNATNSDQILWDRVKNSNDVADYKFYLKQFPKGIYSAVAELQIQRLKRKNTAFIEANQLPEKKIASVRVFLPGKPNDFRLTRGEGIKIHKKPNENSKVLGTVAKRIVVRVVGGFEKHPWKKIELEKGNFGYLKNAYLGSQLETAYGSGELKEAIKNKNPVVMKWLIWRNIIKNSQRAQRGYGKFQRYAGIYYFGFKANCSTINEFLLPWIFWSEGDTLYWGGLHSHPTNINFAKPRSRKTLKFNGYGTVISYAFNSQRGVKDRFGFTGRTVFYHRKGNDYGGMYRCLNPTPDNSIADDKLAIFINSLGSQRGLKLEAFDNFAQGATGAERHDMFKWTLIDPEKVKFDPEKAKSLGVTLPEEIEGFIQVVNVVKYSAAAQAGLQENDVILAVNSKPVPNHSDFSKIESAWKSGDKVKLTIWRNDRAIDLGMIILSNFEYFQNLLANAKSGNAEAMYRVGKMLQDNASIVTKANSKTDDKWAKKQGVIWLDKAVRKGHVSAMFALAEAYNYGYGVQIDNKVALHHYKLAVAKGSTEALSGLAKMYENGFGIDKASPKQALEFYLKAAHKGDIEATEKVAEFYEKGKGVAKNLSKAMHWRRIAAEKGQSNSMVKVAEAYLKGLGVEKNINKAVSWYEKAAEQFDSDAMTALGNIYRLGLGGKKDLKRALYWYQKGADGVDFEAAYQLARMFDKGLGAKQDSNKAAQILFKHAKSNYYLDDDLKKAVSRIKQLSSRTRQALQRLLKKAGVYKGSIDGSLGPATAAAMKKLYE